MQKLKKVINCITEAQLIRTVNTLLLVATFFLLYGLMYYVMDEHRLFSKERTDVKVAIPPEPKEPKKEPNPVIVAEMELRNEWQSVDITYTYVDYDYLGRYFVTSYCPEECGYNGNNYPTGWTTSSGTICHYSSEWDVPTTCAIDHSFGHGYGELLLVGDPDSPDRKMYITEDTGPGVRGAWIDCFVETMDEVRAWGTGYRNVYSVSYVEDTVYYFQWRRMNEYIIYTSSNRVDHHGVPYRTDI